MVMLTLIRFFFSFSPGPQISKKKRCRLFFIIGIQETIKMTISGAREIGVLFLFYTFRYCLNFLMCVLLSFIARWEDCRPSVFFFIFF